MFWKLFYEALLKISLPVCIGSTAAMITWNVYDIGYGEGWVLLVIGSAILGCISALELMK